MLVSEAPKMLNRLGRVVSGGKRGCTRAVLESMGVVCENADGGGWQGADRPQEHEHERVLRRAKACECTGQERERGIGKCNQCSGWRLLPSDRHEEEQCHELRCQECRGIAMCDEGGAPCGTEGTGAESTGPVLAMWEKARAEARAGAAAAGETLKCRGCPAVKHRRCHRSADKGRVMVPGTPEAARRGTGVGTMSIEGEVSDEDDWQQEPTTSAASWVAYNKEEQQRMDMDGGEKKNCLSDNGQKN